MKIIAEMVNFEPMKTAGDVVSVGTLAGYFAGLLPHVATLLTVIWLALRIYETDTVQQTIRKFRKK